MGLFNVLSNAIFDMPDMVRGTEQDRAKVKRDLYKPLGGAQARESRARDLFGMKDFSQLKTGSYDTIPTVLKQELDKEVHDKLDRRL